MSPFGPQTPSHSPQSNYFSTTTVILFYITRKVLFCGEALTPLQIPFFLNNHSLEAQSLSPREIRPTIPLVYMSFPSTTMAFFAIFIMVLFTVFTGRQTQGVCVRITTAKLLSLMPSGTSAHPIILLLCQLTLELCFIGG